MELLKQRVKTMKEEELKAEIARVRKQLAEGEAEQKLQQAQKLLQEILKVYPESRAAKQAIMMLKTNIPSFPEAVHPLYSDPKGFQPTRNSK